MKYAELLQSYIEQSRLTLDEISEKISEKGLTASKQYLSKLQNGKTPPASEKLNLVLAEILDGDSDILEFFSYVEKAPDPVKAILSNFDEELIEAFILLSKDFPDKTINLLGKNDPDIEKSKQFQKINQFAQQTYTNYLENGKSIAINKEIVQKLEKEIGHLPIFQHNKEMIINYLTKYGFKSTLSLVKDLIVLSTVSDENDDSLANVILDEDLYHWYQTLPLAGEKKLRKLRAIWEMMQDDDNE
ncbi:helix-turn-helix transcriptional regulator [Lysinibacillus fusiformis]|uniref:helix-turn-helix transcriptional regulator n=1 Tax=Lysinibacillus fusiformis TaxID=28031 RepID=UPI002E9847E4|nr:helix-turn-helix transcriptional regulator [Lysinibacillus fusiformis]